MLFSKPKSELLKELEKIENISNSIDIEKQIINNDPIIEIKYDEEFIYLNNEKAMLYHLANSVEKLKKLAEAAVKILDKYTLKDAKVADIGGNLGLFSLFLKKKLPELEIHIFEADLDLIEIIHQNLKSFKDIFIHNVAVCDKHNQSIILHKNPDSLQTNSIIKEAVSPFAKETIEKEVRTISLDKFSKENNINAFDIIKIDIQGAESIALNSSKELLSRCRALLLEACFLMPDTLDSLQLANDYFPFHKPINPIIMGADLIFYKNESDFK